MSDNKMLKHQLVKKRITDVINSSTDEVYSRVIKNLAGPIIEKRAKLLEKGIERIEQLEKELNKMKPDVVHYSSDAEGNPTGLKIPAAWSEDQYKKRKAIEDQLSKLHKGFDTALPGKGGVPDYSLLEQMLDKK